MPNTRRRKFSVKNEILRRQESKFHTRIQTSFLYRIMSTFHLRSQDLCFANNIATEVPESSNKPFKGVDTYSPSLKMVPECDSSISIFSDNRSVTVYDKNTKANVSNVKIQNIHTNENRTRKEAITEGDLPIRRTQLERYKSHPEKHARRVKVRSPKRKSVFVSTINDERRSIGTCTNINQDKIEHIDYINYIENADTADEDDEIVNEAEETVSEEGILECTSIDEMCRICHGGDALSSEFGQMISACSCRGTIGRVHVRCLERWLTESGKSRCELCATRYSTRRTHKYGVLKALLMWLFSQNAKQLMVDGLGIMLMSPLAVLAAWLSGKTLAGLMDQEDQIAPWPLASTFVLACMTLVCYYCWIVSAATRHALSWWIWYSSQYEVKLQMEEADE